MVNIGALSYSAGAVLFAILTLLLLTAYRGRLQGILLVFTSAVSAIWCGVIVFYSVYRLPPLGVVQLVEIARDSAWFVFLLSILGYMKRDATPSGTVLRTIGRLVLGLSAALAAFVSIYALFGQALLPPAVGMSVPLYGHALLAVAGLTLVEQLFRNTRTEERAAIKFLCLGVGGIFAYDFFLYSDALLFGRLDRNLWDARGIINAAVVPLIAVAAGRNPQWSLEVFVSRHMVMHTAAIVGAGIYLLLMAVAGYYIKGFGGEWGGFLQIVCLFGAIVLLLVVMFSEQVRAHLKVFIIKHFFANKYDYREEWLRFTHTLSTGEQNMRLRENTIRAIAEIVESPGGMMWIRQDGGIYEALAAWNTRVPEQWNEPSVSELVRFLQARGWVIYLDEYRQKESSYSDVTLPDWLLQMTEAWLVVPLLQRNDLLGFIVLLRSSTKRDLNWEDSDLLKMVGRQAASYLAFLSASEALAEARQFEAFNRLSAYVVHDLKNMVAQLSLVVSNAGKHMHKPGFVEDAVATVENATERMNRLLAQLKQDHLLTRETKPLNIKPLLRDVVTARSVREPIPSLEIVGSELRVNADPDRLAAVIGHLVQNAQEATPVDGRVSVRARCRDEWVTIDVKDSGCGMDKQFIAERLFRPFDTTKGNAGMGVGVHEAREFARSIGGAMEVQSEPGKGTTIQIRLPSENAPIPLLGTGAELEMIN